MNLYSLPFTDMKYGILLLALINSFFTIGYLVRMITIGTSGDSAMFIISAFLSVILWIGTLEL